jgi:hypothetical protein
VELAGVAADLRVPDLGTERAGPKMRVVARPPEGQHFPRPQQSDVDRQVGEVGGDGLPFAHVAGVVHALHPPPLAGLVCSNHRCAAALPPQPGRLRKIPGCRSDSGGWRAPWRRCRTLGGRKPLMLANLYLLAGQRIRRRTPRRPRSRRIGRRRRVGGPYRAYGHMEWPRS